MPLEMVFLKPQNWSRQRNKHDLPFQGITCVSKMIANIILSQSNF